MKTYRPEISSRESAFTLVELSIVLVILGLLIGGVLTGQSLIRAAELRSVATQYSGYMTAVQTFRDKYFALPGDMTNAQAYWGVADPSNCFNAPSTTTATCNGNADGKVIESAVSQEHFHFWKHLANAGLIEGSYDGVTHGSTVYSATKANTPSGRISGSLWFVYNYATEVSFPALFDGVYENSFTFGAINANGAPANPIFKPEEIYNIDTKLDDGKPATGKMVMRAAGGWATCTDATNSTTYTASYLLNSTAVACALVFRQQF